MAGMEGVQVVSLSLSYVMGQALHAAAVLGVADTLADGPQPVEAIAAETGTHAPSLHRLLRTLAAGGIFSEDGDGRFGLTPLGDTLRTDAPGSVRAAVIWVSEPMHYPSCGDLAQTVRTGEPAFERLFGRGYFDQLAADPEAAAVWDAGMACFSGMENGPIPAAYTFPEGATVVDPGGGSGGFLTEVLTRNPSVRGVLFDRPGVAPQILRDAGLLNRCERVDGDFFDTIPGGGDVYVLKRVLHDWDDAHCLDVLKRCREANRAGGRLLVIDAVIPPGTDPHPAKIVDPVMMGILTGRERTHEEFSTLLTAAGFTLTRVITSPRYPRILLRCGGHSPENATRSVNVAARAQTTTAAPLPRTPPLILLWRYLPLTRTPWEASELRRLLATAQPGRRSRLVRQCETMCGMVR